MGDVSRAVYLQWLRAAGGAGVGLALVALYYGSEALAVLASWWLSYWSEQQGQAQAQGRHAYGAQWERALRYPTPSPTGVDTGVGAGAGAGMSMAASMVAAAGTGTGAGDSGSDGGSGGGGGSIGVSPWPYLGVYVAINVGVSLSSLAKVRYSAVCAPVTSLV